MPMTHREKVRLYLERLESSGVSTYGGVPVLDRIAWSVGLKTRPPHFQSFGLLTLSRGAPLAISMLIIFHFASVGKMPGPIGVPVGVYGALLIGLVTGLFAATLFRRQARRLQLHDWIKFPDA